jgi:hypothetical protein
MTRPNVRFGSVLFYVFFVPYTIGVIVFLAAGLAPSVVKEFDHLHDRLHEYADDALLANNFVAIEFRNGDSNTAHRIAVLDKESERPVFRGTPVPSGDRRSFRFRAPGAGSYWLVSQAAPASHIHFKQEIRFAEQGARSIAVRVPSATQHRFERIG